MGHGQLSLPHMLPRFSLPEEVSHVYLISAVRTFLSSAVAIFLPLYIFQQTGSALMALSYATIAFILMSVFLTIVIFLRDRVSFEWLGLISTVAFVLLFTYVYSQDTVTWGTILVAAVLYAISGGLYWLPHHLVYSLYGKEQTSSEYGWEAIINDVVSMVSPIISGAIAYFLGFHVFFAVASAVAIFYLFVWVRRLHHRTLLDFRPLREFYKDVHWDRILLYVIAGMYTVPFMAYPIYLNAIDAGTNNTAFIGLVVGISFLVDAVIAYILGRYLDKTHDYPVGAMGFLLLGFLFLHMLYAPALAAFIVVAFGLVRRISFLPSMSWVYRLGSDTNGRELYARELSLMLGRIVYLLLLFRVGDPLLFTMFVATYAAVVYGVYFYYLSRVKYVEG